MKSLIVEKDGTLTVAEIPIPKYNCRQALVKMISCGICNGTDSKLIHQTFKGFDKSMYPIMLGHEGVGQVIEVGSEVITFKPGDIVLLPFVDADIELYGNLKSGWGAFSEYAVIHDAAAYPEGETPECAFAQTIVPESVNAVDSAMIITLREVLSSIRRFGITPDDSVAVFGCGPVGQTFIRFLSLLGVKKLIAFDIVDNKLQQALDKGAAYAFNSKEVNAADTIHSIYPQGVQFVLDAVGMTSLINDSMEYICDGGKICCYGIAPTCGMKLDWSKSGYNWQLQFQQFPSKREEGLVTGQILNWLEDGTIDLKDYISDYFEFEHILDAFALLEQHGISKKGIVVF